jgi:hypothetical protein
VLEKSREDEDNASPQLINNKARKFHANQSPLRREVEQEEDNLPSTADLDALTAELAASAISPQTRRGHAVLAEVRSTLSKINNPSYPPVHFTPTKSANRNDSPSISSILQGVSEYLAELNAKQSSDDNYRRTLLEAVHSVTKQMNQFHVTLTSLHKENAELKAEVAAVKKEQQRQQQLLSKVDNSTATAASKNANSADTANSSRRNSVSIADVEDSEATRRVSKYLQPSQYNPLNYNVSQSHEFSRSAANPFQSSAKKEEEQNSGSEEEEEGAGLEEETLQLEDEDDRATAEFHRARQQIQNQNSFPNFAANNNANAASNKQPSAAWPLHPNPSNRPTQPPIRVTLNNSKKPSLSPDQYTSSYSPAAAVEDEEDDESEAYLNYGAAIPQPHPIAHVHSNPVLVQSKIPHHNPLNQPRAAPPASAPAPAASTFTHGTLHNKQFRSKQLNSWTK